MILIIFFIVMTIIYVIGMTASRAIYEAKIGNKTQQELEKIRKELEKKQEELNKQQDKITKSWEAIEDYLDKYGLPKKLK